MNTEKSGRDFVQSVIGTLIGQKAWGVTVGTGSFLTMEFGNPQISTNIQERGEFHLWIYGCAWRIEKDGKFIVGSQDDREYITEKVVPTLNDLAVLEIEVNPTTFDTTIKF